jgi:hypothetical protein
MLNMQSRLDPLTGSSLKHLHRATIDDPQEVQKFLRALQRSEVELGNGVDFKSQRRLARVVTVRPGSLELRVENIVFHPREQIYFDFEFEGLGYFLVASPQASQGLDIIVIDCPKAIYQAERRDLFRDSVSDRSISSNRVAFRDRAGRTRIATLRDLSYQGLSLALPEQRARELRFPLKLKFLDGDRKGESVYGELKHTRDDAQQRGWLRLGMSISRVPTGQLIDVERHRSLLRGGAGASTWRRLSFAGAMAKGGSTRVVNRLRRQPATVAVDVVALRHGIHEIIDDRLDPRSQGFDTTRGEGFAYQPAQPPVFFAVEHQEVAIDHGPELGVGLRGLREGLHDFGFASVGGEVLVPQDELNIFVASGDERHEDPAIEEGLLFAHAPEGCVGISMKLGQERVEGIEQPVQ